MFRPARPNGAGKTTLISVLSCLLAPSAGSAKLAGQELRLDVAELRMQVGIVPQDLAIYGDLTARETGFFSAGSTACRRTAAEAHR